MTRVFTDYLLLGDSCLGCGRSPQLTADGHEKGTKSFARSSRPLTSIVGLISCASLCFFSQSFHRTTGKYKTTCATAVRFIYFESFVSVSGSDVSGFSSDISGSASGIGVSGLLSSAADFVPVPVATVSSEILTV